jgi:hypothetical protein
VATEKTPKRSVVSSSVPGAVGSTKAAAREPPLRVRRTIPIPERTETLTFKLNTDKVREELVEGVVTHLEAKKARNKAAITNLLTHPTGIGEHTDLVDDILRHLGEYTAAQDEQDTFEELLADKSATDNLIDVIETAIDGTKILSYSAATDYLQKAVEEIQKAEQD